MKQMKVLPPEKKFQDDFRPRGGDVIIVIVGHFSLVFLLRIVVKLSQVLS